MKTTYDAVNEFKGDWAITDYDQFTDRVSQMKANFGKCEQSYSDYKVDYHLSPEPTLTYTQAMADNGELPSVGMEFIWRTWGEDVLCKMLGVHKDECWFDTKEGTKLVTNITNLKPLTPPIKLIDGKAYQFDFKGDINSFDSAIGIYDKAGTGAMWVKNKVFLVSQCTNIQPLTAEAK
tara:strand:+ start:7 stop:540 length:534 start_codon:yes stop_codon:yes gene_type:complete